MIVFPKKVRFEFVVAAALLLGSCNGDGPKLMSHDEVEDIASDVATDAINDSPKISDLESRVEQLEQKTGG